MTNFYTHVLSGGHLIEDLEGEEFSSLEAAQAAAIEAARELVAEQILSGSTSTVCEFRIHDSVGHLLDTMRFSCTMSVLSRGSAY